MTQAGICQGRDWLGLTGIVSDALGLACIRSDWVGFARNDLDSLFLQINYCAVVLVDHEFFWLPYNPAQDAPLRRLGISRLDISNDA